MSSWFAPAQAPPAGAGAITASDEKASYDFADPHSFKDAAGVRPTIVYIRRLTSTGAPKSALRIVKTVLSLAMAIFALRLLYNAFLCSTSYLATNAAALTFTTRTQLATFDDQEVYEGLSISQYKGLQWSGFKIVEGTPEGISGVIAQSGSRYACASTAEAQKSGPPTITIRYDKSHVSFFDLQSFSWACIVEDNDHSILQIPQNCTVTVSGFEPSRRGRMPDVSREFAFDVPIGALDTEMRKVQMLNGLEATGFVALQRIEFRVWSTLPAVICLDDVKFKTYNVTNWESSFQGLGELRHGEQQPESTSAPQEPVEPAEPAPVPVQ